MTSLTWLKALPWVIISDLLDQVESSSSMVGPELFDKSKAPRAGSKFITFLDQSKGSLSWIELHSSL